MMAAAVDRLQSEGDAAQRLSDPAFGLPQSLHFPGGVLDPRPDSPSSLSGIANPPQAEHQRCQSDADFGQGWHEAGCSHDPSVPHTADVCSSVNRYQASTTAGGAQLDAMHAMSVTHTGLTVSACLLVVRRPELDANACI